MSSIITDIDRYRETLLFWKSISSKTQSLVKLNFAIYREGNSILHWIPLNNNKPLLPEDAYQLLKKENAWYKNIKDKKSVLFQFAKDQTYNIVIVDDIPINGIRKKDVFLIWQTSPNKYQVAFILDKYVDAETVIKIQRVIIDQCGGDKGCVGATHNVKVPGFYNTKYLVDAPYVRVQHRGTNVLHVDQILRFYEMKLKPKENRTENNTNTLSSNQSNYKLPDEKKKDWLHFYAIKQDKSAADFSYALYLMHFNLSDEEIRQILLNESDDIENRKARHLDDYLERTVRKAREFFKPFKSKEGN